ncbi:Protein YIF1B-B [Trichinella pseudospiralis]|uniref:Protein YIF1 n=1 Tax=Trichinella pseudospiralis TaxID=6337 RepID=A0A0V1ENX1_TRIPS|nr:Protein YIF1B-B [Trichinella pseudospiralis]KRZ24364.1 Protein YIF1B-B [Trichinella pseudospiralis]KRZ40973.1 Protein YIF1B-B [Trichinella pseudospiralis]
MTTPPEIFFVDVDLDSQSAHSNVRQNYFSFNENPIDAPMQPSSKWAGNAFTDSIASEPVADFAKAYGGRIAQEGKEKLSHYISLARMKQYFDVDNKFVGRKLSMILFPFFGRFWGNSRYTESPRLNPCAVDLYIPTLAVVTYIFVSGWLLGLQNRFSPEKLGLLSSATMAWLFAENIVVIVMRYIMSVSQSLTFWDTLAFSGYKYVGMICSLIAFIISGRSAYNYCLTYCCISVSVFLARSLKVYVADARSYEEGKKRKMYLLLFISLTQPFIMWWLTSSLISYQSPYVPNDVIE